jgi:alpha-L-fucosidase
MRGNFLAGTLAACAVLAAGAVASAEEKQAPEAADLGEFGALAASKDYTPPRDPAVLRKLSRWQDQKFGLLITWGPYSQWGVVESWTLCPVKYDWNQRPGIHADEGDLAYKQAYENLPVTFNPVRFDPQRWAAAAKGAGLKYVLLMSKHCDGFNMYDTVHSDYKITAPRCPFSRNPRADVVRELASAFRRQAFSVGMYFSKADWNSRCYWNPGFPLVDVNINYAAAKRPDLWKAYKEFTWNQVRELMTGYGPIDILWLDDGWVRAPGQDLDLAGMAAMARGHQPGLIVVDRTVPGEYENYITPEQEIPDRRLPYPWETCMTMGTSWSFKPHDAYKTAGTLVRNLCRVVARGGNYLINFGPGPDGELDPAVYDRFRDVGAWLKVNGEAIYGTRPVKPYERGDYVFTGKADGTTYAILLAKDDLGTIPPSMELPVRLAPSGARITLLGYGPLPGERADPGRVAVAIPAAVRANPPCAHAWTLKVKPR